MDLNKLNDLANRIMKGGRGAGAGVGLLAAIGGAAYGVYQSMYTGELDELHHMSNNTSILGVSSFSMARAGPGPVS